VIVDGPVQSYDHILKQTSHPAQAEEQVLGSTMMNTALVEA
jgi:hypothetical protein